MAVVSLFTDIGGDTFICILKPQYLDGGIDKTSSIFWALEPVPISVTSEELSFLLDGDSTLLRGRDLGLSPHDHFPLPNKGYGTWSE